MRPRHDDPQTPIGSGFGAAATASDVIRGCDLTKKVAIVTGGYAGIGLETAGWLPTSSVWCATSRRLED
jgi:hypothetical protein